MFVSVNLVVLMEESKFPAVVIISQRRIHVSSVATHLSREEGLGGRYVLADHPGELAATYRTGLRNSTTLRSVNTFCPVASILEELVQNIKSWQSISLASNQRSNMKRCFGNLFPITHNWRIEIQPALHLGSFA